MITLREFLKLIRGEHYRIYYPNRDCLVFESFWVHHSPYTFSKKSKKTEYVDAYWNDNTYNEQIYVNGWKNPDYDEETKAFLDVVGGKIVHAVELSGFHPYKRYVDKDGHAAMEPLEGLSRQNAMGYIDCYNIFVSDYSPHLDKGCLFCPRSVINNTENQSVIRIGDAGDRACRRCKWFANPTGKEQHEETSL